MPCMRGRAGNNQLSFDAKGSYEAPGYGILLPRCTKS